MSDAAIESEIDTQTGSRLFERAMPLGYRDELRTLLAERPVEARRQTGSNLLFEVGGLRLALPVRVAAAVAPVLHVARVPHRSGTVLMGLVAFRGELIPCCSLARLLDLTAGAAGEPRNPAAGGGRTLILEESPGRLWAMPIDAVVGVRTNSEPVDPAQGEQASDAAAQLAQSWVCGHFAERGGSFALLDHEVLFRRITLATA